MLAAVALVPALVAELAPVPKVVALVLPRLRCTAAQCAAASNPAHLRGTRSSPAAGARGTPPAADTGKQHWQNKAAVGSHNFAPNPLHYLKHINCNTEAWCCQSAAHTACTQPTQNIALLILGNICGAALAEPIGFPIETIIGSKHPLFRCSTFARRTKAKKNETTAVLKFVARLKTNYHEANSTQQMNPTICLPVESAPKFGGTTI